MLEALAEAEAADTELRNELKAAKRDNERLALELAQANSRAAELEQSGALAEARIAELTELVDTVRRNAARADEEVARLRWQNRQLNQSLARANTAHKAALAEAEKARAEMARELEAARNAAAQLEADVAGLYKELKAKDQEIAAANSMEVKIGGKPTLYWAPPAPAEPAPKPALEPAAGPGPEPVSGPDDEHDTIRSSEIIRLSHEVAVSALAQADTIGKSDLVYAEWKPRLPTEPASTATVASAQDPGSVPFATSRARPPFQADGFLWPVEGKVIGAFGPIDQGRRRDGIDIAARRGAPVLAAEDGIVAYAGDSIPSYGQIILLRHEQGYITTYGHCATLLVKEGDVVKRGQLIARVGDTGGAPQSMLYFELRKGSIPINPQSRLVHDTTKLASRAEWGSIE